MDEISINDFQKIEIRSGIIVKAEEFPRAKNPAYKVWVDFGEFDIKKTSAQITKNYSCEDLIGKNVMGCLNLGTRNIAGFISEFLLLGFSDKHGEILLAASHSKTPNGKKLH